MGGGRLCKDRSCGREKVVYIDDEEVRVEQKTLIPQYLIDVDNSDICWLGISPFCSGRFPILLQGAFGIYGFWA